VLACRMCLDPIRHLADTTAPLRPPVRAASKPNGWFASIIEFLPPFFRKANFSTDFYLPFGTLTTFLTYGYGTYSPPVPAPALALLTSSRVKPVASPPDALVS
jgi:hypothetical protein